MEILLGLMIALLLLTRRSAQPVPPPPDPDPDPDPPPPPPPGNGTTNPFGITQFYPTASGGTEWDSSHWDNGHSRNISRSHNNGDLNDRDDPSGMSSLHGSSGYHIDGNGLLILRPQLSGGTSPRFYIDPPKVGKRGFLNVETTLYYRRGTGPSGNAGISIGARSHTNGHSPFPDNCLAGTYYGRMTGSPQYVDYMKELIHASYGVRGRRTMSDIPGFQHLRTQPVGVWVGFKYIIRNRDNNRNVQMETYMDLTNGENGGNWVKVTEYIDDGDMRPTHDSDFNRCRDRNPGRYPQGESTIMTGINGIAGDGGNVFIRQTPTSEERSEAAWKWWTVREIDPLP